MKFIVIKMKKILIILLCFIYSCATQKQLLPIKIVITHIEVIDEKTKEVWGRKGYMIYTAKCTNLSDSVKIGTVLTLSRYEQQSNCVCLFKRIK